MLPVDVDLEPYAFDGAAATLVMVRDASARKHAEELRVHQAQLAELRAMVSAALAEQSYPIEVSLQNCTEAIARTLGVELAGIWLADEDGSALNRVAQSCMDPATASDLAEAERAAVDAVAPLRSVDADCGARSAAISGSSGASTFAACPLTLANRLIGVIITVSPITIPKHTTDALASIADPIAHGVDRRRVASALERSESALRQAQKMEVVGRLAGGVAHDFNNLLTVAIGYAELALRRIKPDDPIREDLEAIHKAADRGRNLTRQLLTFSRQQVWRPAEISIANVVEGVGTCSAGSSGTMCRSASTFRPSAGRRWRIKVISSKYF